LLSAGALKVSATTIYVSNFPSSFKTEDLIARFSYVYDGPVVAQVDVEMEEGEETASERAERLQEEKAAKVSRMRVKWLDATSALISFPDLDDINWIIEKESKESAVKTEDGAEAPEGTIRVFNMSKYKEVRGMSSRPADSVFPYAFRWLSIRSLFVVSSSRAHDPISITNSARKPC
jgi:hypothetical protein